MKKILLFVLGMAISVVAIPFLSMKPATNLGYLQLHFSDYVGKELLQLDSAHYKNELGQDFTVSNFKYYVGNFKLYDKNGLQYTWDNYYLVKADDPKSQDMTLTVIPDGDYTSMTFTLGVDSLHNCSGAQSGALDPANGMFWAWNSGYIFLKLEGKAAASTSPGHTFEYHIGGYKKPSNCIRTITVDLKNNPVKMRFEASSAMEIKADILEILKTPLSVDFSKLSSVADFHHSAEIADNYKDMFSVLKVENEQ